MVFLWFFIVLFMAFLWKWFSYDLYDFLDVLVVGMIFMIFCYNPLWSLWFLWFLWSWTFYSYMPWTFLPNTAQFFRFKNWCKITFQKKSSLTSALSCAEQVVKLPFFSKKCIFRAEKGIFSKSSFYTKMFSDPKYNFSVHQK